MTTIIALTGPAGAGKSTAAAYLAARYGAVRYSLAYPLKEIARRALDFSYPQVYGTQADKDAEDPRYGFSPRWFLQRLGTEGIRDVLGADFWVRHALERIAADAPRVATIDDCRFENEAHAIRAAGGVVIRLHPPRDEAVAAEDTHASEQQWRRLVADYNLRPETRGERELHELLDLTMEYIIAQELLGCRASNRT